MNFEAWFEKAVELIDADISVGQTFEVKKLFKGTEWDEESIADRRRFGRFFSDKVKSGYPPNIKRVEEAYRGSNKYVKTN